MKRARQQTKRTALIVAALLSPIICGAATEKTPLGPDLLPALSDGGEWQLVNNAGPQVQIARQGAVDVNTFTGTVTQGDGRASDVTIQPVRTAHLVDGQRYKFVYDIRGDQVRDVRVIVQTVGDKQMNYYLLSRIRSVGLGYSHYEDDFTARNLKGRPVLVEFAIGAYEGRIDLENVSLNAIDPQPGGPPAPAAG